MDVCETITMKDLIIEFVTASVSIMVFVLVEILFGRRTFNLLEKHERDREIEIKTGN